MSKQYTLRGPDNKEYQSNTPGELGGHKGNKIYGRLDCPTALRYIALGTYQKSRVFFANERDAIFAGYRPCADCMKESYQAWKKSLYRKD